MARFNEGWLLQEIFESDIVLTFSDPQGDAARWSVRGFRSRATKDLDARLKIRRRPRSRSSGCAVASAWLSLSRVDGISRPREIFPPPGGEGLASDSSGAARHGCQQCDPPVGEGRSRSLRSFATTRTRSRSKNQEDDRRTYGGCRNPTRS
jgi:hypothetical protein